MRHKGKSKAVSFPVVSSIDLRAEIFLFKLSILVGVVVLGSTLALGTSIIGEILGILLLGAAFAHAVELQHESLHGLAFRTKFVNRLVGFFLGVPMLVSFSHYRARHLKHHRLLGTKGDSEFFDKVRLQGLSRAEIFLTAFCPTRIIKNLLVVIPKAILGLTLDPELSDDTASRVRREYLVIGVILLLSTILSLASEPAIILKFWLLPLFCVAEPLHFFIELPEHLGCNTESRDPLQNTRSITGSWFSFWFTNGNNLHVEHHLYPAIPIYRLPEVHSKIRYAIANRDESYISCFRRLFFSGEERQ